MHATGGTENRLDLPSCELEITKSPLAIYLERRTHHGRDAASKGNSLPLAKKQRKSEANWLSHGGRQLVSVG